LLVLGEATNPKKRSVCSECWRKRKVLLNVEDITHTKTVVKIVHLQLSPWSQRVHSATDLHMKIT